MQPPLQRPWARQEVVRTAGGGQRPQSPDGLQGLHGAGHKGLGLSCRGMAPKSMATWSLCCDLIWKWVFAAVIKLRRGLNELRWAPKPVKPVSSQGTFAHRHPGRSCVKTEAEIGMRRPQPRIRGTSEPSEGSGLGRGLPWGLQTEPDCWALDLGCWPLDSSSGLLLL